MAFASRAVCLLVVSLALCQVATVRATETTDIVAELKGITTMSADLRDLTLKINDVNFIFEEPRLSQGFEAIIGQVGQAIDMLNGAANNPTLADGDAQTVVKALKEFVMIHQQLLNAVICKHGILTLIPLFGRIRQVLDTLQSAVEAFGDALLKVIPTQAPAAKGLFSALDETLSQAIAVYSN